MWRVNRVDPERAQGQASGGQGPGGQGEGDGATPTPKTCPSCGARYPVDALFCSLDGAPLTTSPKMIAAAAASDPYLGREILGHIEVRQLVGIGAMGRVYRAFQRGIDRDVAVKILHRELSHNETIVARFHREAKVASRLSHPNVVHVLLVGQLPDGAMYIIMEYLDGMSLQSGLLAAGGAFPLPRALHIALQLCEAAGEAHAQGVVHRDLKPENVMLVHRADDPDFVKVLDFGIARLNWDENAMNTAAGLIFGTARYISPEGAQGERVGAPGDVYSIATMVYQMLAGRTPFDGEQAVSLLVQQTRDAPPHLKSIARASYVPEPVATVVMKNLAKRADERASDARVFGRTLLEAAIRSGLSAQDILARPALLDRGRGSHASVVQMPSLERTKQHALDKDVAARIGAASHGPAHPPAGPAASSRPAPHGPSQEPLPPKTAYETPAPAETRAVMRTQLTPPTAETTRWTPDADFEARVAAGAPGPETTIDDQHPALSSQLTGPPSATVTGESIATPSAPVSRTVAFASSPTSVDFAADAIRSRRAWAHPRTLAVAGIVAGVLGVATLTWRGVSGSASALGSPRSGAVAAAENARLLQHWDAPPGDNVRDITDQALARWPNDAELLGVRRRAASDLLQAARSRHDVGDTLDAVDWAKLAGQLDPSNREAKALAVQWSAPPAEVSAVAPESVPPLARTNGVPSGPSVAAATAANANGAAPAVRVALDASNARPAVGQPVDFVARVSGPPGSRFDAASFHIAGPGLSAGTDMPAADDGSGVLRTTFTFMQAGRFEVTFNGRTASGPVRAARSVAVGDPSASSRTPAVPPAAASPPAAPPPQSAGQKWL